MIEIDDQAAGATQILRSVFLPLPGDGLLLPGAMLAEVLTFGSLRAVPDTPPWVIGSMSWRGRELPVVNLAASAGGARRLNGEDTKPFKRAVVYALNPGVNLRCYALLCSAVPRPVLSSALRVQAASESANTGRMFAALAVRVDGARAYIPDVDALEAAMLHGKDSWLRFAADGTGATRS